MGLPSNAGNEAVKMCDNGSYCCRSANTSESALATECCADDRGFFLDRGKITAAHVTSSASASASTATSTPTVTVTSTPSPSTNTGAIVGGLLGGAGLISLLLGGWIILKRRRKRSDEAAATEGLSKGVVAIEPSDHRKYELDSHGRLVKKEERKLFEMNGDLVGGKTTGPMEVE